jgi:hypothetical protein
VTASPSSYRTTLILIIPGTTGVVTGHFEDKAIVACCHSEVAIVCPFIRVGYRVRPAQRAKVATSGLNFTWNQRVEFAAGDGRDMSVRSELSRPARADRDDRGVGGG